MFYQRHGDTYTLRFEDGEGFPGTLLDFLSEHEIAGADLTGIGAMKRATIAYFDPDAKEYIDYEFDEQVEVLGLVGNVAMHEGAPLVHAHIVLGRRDYSLIGGHLRDGIVRPTLEVVLRTVGGRLDRTVDPRYGLPGLNLDTRY